MSDRPLRGCEVCGQVDDGPRHVVAVEMHPDDAAAAGLGGVPSADMVRKLVENGISTEGLDALLDPTTSVRHMDCCASVGCPAELGAQCGDPERAGSGKQNTALLSHITGEPETFFAGPAVRLDKGAS